MALAAGLLIAGVAGLWSRASAEGVACALHLPTNSVAFNGHESPDSFAAITLSLAPSGYDATNGTYFGWCINYDDPISYGQVYAGKLFSSLSTNLPPMLQALARDKVNYILNHKQGTFDDVQNAVWHALGQTNAPVTPLSQAMLAGADAAGAGFVPASHEVVAIIIEPDEAGVQRLVIEMRCPTDAGNGIDYGPLRILSIAQAPESHIELRIACAPGPAYVIESATNLVNWEPLATVVNTNLDGIFQFIHTNGIHSATRFYRITRP